MNKPYDAEFNFSQEKVSMPKEYAMPSENKSTAREFPESLPKTAPYDEYLSPKTGTSYEESDSERIQKNHKRIKNMFLMPVISTVAAVSIIFSAYGYDPLHYDIFSEHGDYYDIYDEFYHDHHDGYYDDYYDDYYDHHDDYHDDYGSSDYHDDYGSSDYNEDSGSSDYNEGSTEEADYAFPTLSNLEPNGLTGYNGGTVMNEEYILVNSTEGQQYIHVNDAWGQSVANVPGLSYDSNTNTLTLNNYSGPMLEVNLMGNGFTINLIGDNYLDCLRVWGWFYGGSVKITGSGSLTVNRNSDYTIGITIEGECSDSCLMIDSGVKLDVYGSQTAIAVKTSSLGKGIYYLNPLRVSGGIRTEGGDYVLDANGREASSYGDFYDYTFLDVADNGTMAKHVEFY